MGVNFFRGLWVPNALRARRGRELQGKDRVSKGVYYKDGNTGDKQGTLLGS